MLFRDHQKRSELLLLTTSLLGCTQQQNFVCFNFYREKEGEIFSTRNQVSRRREKGKAYVSFMGAGLLGPDGDL